MLYSNPLLAHRSRCGFCRLARAIRSHNRTSARQLSSTTAPASTTPAAAAAAVLEAPTPGLSFASRNDVWDNQNRLQLKNLTYEELQEWCESIGQAPQKALPLWKGMYQDGRWLRGLSDADLAAATAAASSGGASSQLQLSGAVRSAVQQQASLDGGLTLQSVTTARDGTHKLVFALHGSGVSGSVETVLIPMRDRGGSRLRYTACLSSQVGCAMNCQFCFTGRMGLLGNLSTAQIVEQLVEARRWLAEYTRQQSQHLQQQQQQQQQQQLGVSEGPQQAAASSSSSVDADQVSAAGGDHAAAAAWSSNSSSSISSSSSSGKGRPGKLGKKSSSWSAQPPRINNVVFMGMGEPLHNPAVWSALDILTHPAGLALSRSKVIVSTVGLVPQLRQLRASGKAKLAVSLHATTNEVRSWIVPTNRKYPLAELMGALRELYPLTPDSSSSCSSSSSSGGAEVLPHAASEASHGSSSSSSSIKPGSKRVRPASDDFVVIEYVLLKDVNDTDEDAHRLLELLSDVYCMINLIVFNPHEGTRFQRSDEQQVKRFREILMSGGKVCTLRISKGDDEMAACGQLGGTSMGLAPRPAPLLKPPQKLREKLPGAAAALAAMQPAAAADDSMAAAATPV